MSGIKGATVRSNLNKVVNTVRSGIAECERAAADAQSIGRADFTRQFASAEHAHRGMKRQFAGRDQGVPSRRDGKVGVFAA